MKRSEQKINDTWNMEDMFPSDKVWEEDFEKATKEVAKYKEFSGKIKDSKDKLIEFLKFNDEISLLAERLYVYANQKYHEDMGNGKYQAYSGKAQKLVVDIGSASAFFEPEVLEIDEATINQWLEDEKLNNYKRYIEEILRSKKHTLDKKTEEILAKSKKMANAADNIYAMYNGADIDFPTVKDSEGKEIKITHGNFVPILSGEDRELRKNAFTGLYNTYGAMKNTIAATYNANVEQANFYADVRKYPSSRAMYLDGSNIPESVYDNLIKVVHENMDLMYRYVRLRKKSLGVEELHMYDIYAPIAKAPSKKYSFEEAKAIVKEGLAPMGEEYLSKLQEGFDNRWIDVYENEGKRSGAYSWGAYGTHPYVLLNFQGTLDHVFTLAHEMVQKGETLTADVLCETYYDLNKLYFGEDIVLDKEIALEWARIPHFYNPFYVYQYATGISAAITLSRKIMKEGEAGVKDYMKFLTGGGSKAPIDLLKLAGVDMTKEEPVREALQLFRELLDEMEALI